MDSLFLFLFLFLFLLLFLLARHLPGITLDIPEENASLLNYDSDKDQDSVHLNGGEDEIGSLAPQVVHPNKLNQYFATAISGNGM